MVFTKSVPSKDNDIAISTGTVTLGSFVYLIGRFHSAREQSHIRNSRCQSYTTASSRIVTSLQHRDELPRLCKKGWMATEAEPPKNLKILEMGPRKYQNSFEDQQTRLRNGNQFVDYILLLP